MTVFVQFIDQFLTSSPNDDENDESSPTSEDCVRNYSLCLLKYYFIVFAFSRHCEGG